MEQISQLNEAEKDNDLLKFELSELQEWTNRIEKDNKELCIFDSIVVPLLDFFSDCKPRTR